MVQPTGESAKGKGARNSVAKRNYLLAMQTSKNRPHAAPHWTLQQDQGFTPDEKSTGILSKLSGGTTEVIELSARTAKPGCVPLHSRSLGKRQCRQQLQAVGTA